MVNVISIFTTSLGDSEILSKGSFTSEIYYVIAISIAITIAIFFLCGGGNKNCNHNHKHG